MQINHEQSARMALLVSLFKKKIPSEEELPCRKNCPKILLDQLKDDDIIFSFEEWKNDVERVLGVSFFEYDNLRSNSAPEYVNSFLSDIRLLEEKSFTFNIFITPQNKIITTPFRVVDEDFQNAWIVMQENQLRSKLFELAKFLANEWFDGRFVNKDSSVNTPKLLSPKQQLALVCLEINEYFSKNQRDETEQQFMIFLDDSEKLSGQNINLLAVLLYLNTKKVIPHYMILPNFKGRAFLTSIVDKYQLEKTIKDFQHLLPSDIRNDLIAYFDLVFDFTNGEYTNQSNSKKTSFQVIDSQDNKTNYYTFKILLENKGEWLSEEDFANHGFKLPEKGSVRSLDETFKYLKKIKFESNNPNLRSTTKWIEFDKNKGLRIIKD